MPSLEVVWLIIGFVPAVVVGNPPVGIIMGAGAVFVDQSRCETVVQDRRNKWLETGHQPEDATIRCMPYWIDKQAPSIPRKGRK